MDLFKFARDAGEKFRESVGDMASGIKDRITGHKTEVDGLEVEEKDGRVVIKGKARSRAEAEKAIIAAGNTPGVGEVESHIEIEDTAPAATFYTVVSGDTLSKIAKSHYGDAMKYPVIFEANKPMLSDPDKIYPGQVLRIPPL
ncbi:MAG: peptidoglycan-binding protein LysM [Parvularculaceae bacterium]|nr:peptidoglycan-binding protein LysM [Parvularculaceae bacterium]